LSENEDRGSARLRPPLRWKTTALVREAAVEGMSSRAEFELDQISAGSDIASAHGETVGRYRQYEQLFHGADRFARRIGTPLQGRVADLGSGTGTAACIFSKMPSVQEVLAIEISEPFVREVMPIVFQEHQGQVEKIQRVVGDFNHLDLPAESLDIITEIDSFHNSEDLSNTLKECWRVLRPNGMIVAVDRGWPDRYTQAKLDAMLDQEFPEHMKIKYDIPLAQHFTRRDWGEHEYTLRQWFGYFEEAGFDTGALLQWHPPFANRLFLKLPTFNLSIAMAANAYRRGARRMWIYGFAFNRVLFFAVKRPLQGGRLTRS